MLVVSFYERGSSFEFAQRLGLVERFPPFALAEQYAFRRLVDIDVIAADKKLIEGYIIIVKELAIRNGVAA